MVDSGVSPDAATYTSLIKGFIKTGNPDSALSVLGDMESKGCYAELVICNLLIDCLSNTEGYDDALSVYFSLAKIKLTPDFYTFCALKPMFLCPNSSTFCLC